jgi:hypothetical protein
LPFFIVVALAFGGESCADDSRSRWPLRESYNQEPAPRGQSEYRIALLGQRVVGVGEEDGEAVTEGRDGFVERHPVLAKVGGGLVGVPFELVGHGRNLGTRALGGERA